MCRIVTRKHCPHCNTRYGIEKMVRDPTCQLAHCFLVSRPRRTFLDTATLCSQCEGWYTSEDQYHIRQYITQVRAWLNDNFPDQDTRITVFQSRLLAYRLVDYHQSIGQADGQETPPDIQSWISSRHLNMLHEFDRARSSGGAVPIPCRPRASSSSSIPQASQECSQPIEVAHSANTSESEKLEESQAQRVEHSRQSLRLDTTMHQTEHREPQMIVEELTDAGYTPLAINFILNGAPPELYHRDVPDSDDSDEMLC